MFKIFKKELLEEKENEEKYVKKSANRIYIHPTVIMEPRVEIGDGTKIWHYAVIREGVKIGKNCTICQHVYIDRNVVIGDNCKIKNGVMLFEAVTVKDNVFIGPGVVTTNVINPDAVTERKHEFRPTIIEKGATVGAHSTLICGITISEYAFIGAGSVVTNSIGRHVLAFGNPARPKGYVNKIKIKCKFSEVDL